MNRIVGFIIIAIIIIWILTSPDSAAHTTHNLYVLLRNAAHAIIRFVTQLV
jgi:hypothetical protein